jgi:hypothetical protein
MYKIVKLHYIIRFSFLTNFFSFQGINCKQYQEDLEASAVNDKAASQTQIMMKRMLDDRDAMNSMDRQVRFYTIT